MSSEDTIAQLYAQANALREEGKEKEALALYRRILAINPHFIQAEKHIEDILQAHERKHMQHATLFTTKGDYEKAIREYNELLAFNPNIWKARKNLALLYQKAGTMNKAIIEIKKAITLAPELCGLHLTLAKFCDIQGNYDLALEEYRKALELNPIDAYIQKHTEIAEKISAFYKERLHDTDDPFVFVDIGNLFMEKEMPEKAIELFTEAYNRAPRNQEILYALARAHYRIKHFKKAIQLFSLALQITPPTVGLDEIYYHLGLSYSGLNNHKEAIEALTSCINVNQNGRLVSRAQATINVLQNYLKGIPNEG